MTYTVKPGDTLSKIAKSNGISTTQLLQANPQITDPNKIKVGDVLTVPNGSIDLTTDNTKPLPPITPPAPTPTPTTTSGGALGAAIAEALGELSAKYETGGRGPGTVSTGSGDPGGVSYGSYQMATKMGTVARFVAQTGFQWAADFTGLTPGTAPFTACCPAKRKVLSIQPWSFANAISEPVNEIAPISAPTTASTVCDRVSVCTAPPASP